MSSLHMQSRRVRHRILSYYSPFGVKPLSFPEWISMKSVHGRYVLTDRKVKGIIDSLVSSMAKKMLDSLTSDSFLELTRVAKEMSTVKRDREYYGTVERDISRTNMFDDISSPPPGRKGFSRFLFQDENGDII